MSSIFEKNGVFWYQRYVYNTETGKRNKRVYHSMRTKNRDEAEVRQEIKDKFYEELEASEALFPTRPLSQCITEYLAVKKSEIALQKRSLNTYRSDDITLTQFKNYILDNHGDIDIRKILKAHILDFRVYRESLKKVKSKSTIALNLRVTRAFFSYCIEKEYIENHPFQNIKIPKSERRDQYPKKQELEKLRQLFELEVSSKKYSKKKESYGKHRKQEKFQWFHDNDWFSSYIWIILNTGMRVGEVSILKWKQGKEDVGQGHSYSYAYLSDDFETITIHFKRRKRELPVKNLKAFFKKIPKSYRIKKNDKVTTRKSTYVFESESTGQSHHTTTCANLWKKFLKDSKLNMNWTIHSLRHSVASYMLNNGQSLFHVSKILGHSTLEMLDIYGHSTTQDMEDALSSLSNLKNESE